MQVSCCYLSITSRQTNAKRFIPIYRKERDRSTRHHGNEEEKLFGRDRCNSRICSAGFCAVFALVVDVVTVKSADCEPESRQQSSGRRSKALRLRARKCSSNTRRLLVSHCARERRRADERTCGSRRSRKRFVVCELECNASDCGRRMDEHYRPMAG